MGFRYGKIACWTCDAVLHEGWPRWWHALTRWHRATTGPRYELALAEVEELREQFRRDFAANPYKAIECSQ